LGHVAKSFGLDGVPTEYAAIISKKIGAQDKQKPKKQEAPTYLKNKLSHKDEFETGF